jgi:NADPH-dependent 2,4-dienoyl-CoA reductase/sulfur reductase-like enzyme
MERAFDVVVVGAGPAGMAAAVSAAEAGRSVAVVDDNPAAGGQIWRRGETLPGAARAWLGRFERAAITRLPGSRVFDGTVDRVCVDGGGEGFELRYQALVLATGARERFLPFPGWTLPGVFGAGGLDAMARGGLPVAGKRVVVAGTGPLLLAVAAHLARRGAKIVAICEQAPLGSVARFAVRMATEPAKVMQGIEYRWAARRAKMHFGCWPVAAHGAGALDSVTLRQSRRRWRVGCDFLACGFHLVPNVELTALLGCRLENGFVAADAVQQTSVAGVFCAGEPCGIGGVEAALLEGQIAGLAAAGRIDEARALAPRRRKLDGFVRALQEAYALRPELRAMADEGTILCRCEDVRYGTLRGRESWREAKLQTRCGMGSCQGRVCGAAAEFLFGWRVDAVRPPIFPAPVSSLTSCNLAENEREAR